MIDDDEFLHSMYGQDEDDEEIDEDAPSLDVRPVNRDARTQVIRMGAITYEVPSMAYLKALEAMLEGQARSLLIKERRIRKLDAEMVRLKDAVRKLVGENSRISRELDQKVDGREW